MKILFLSGIALFVTFGCARPQDARHPEDAVATENGGRHEPQSKEEREILERVAALPADVREKLGTRTLSASRTYSAASGYSCRNVTIEEGARREQRLACGDGDGWFFVPDVYHQGDVAETPSEPIVQVSPTGEATVVDAPRTTNAPDEEGL